MTQNKKPTENEFGVGVRGSYGEGRKKRQHFRQYNANRTTSTILNIEIQTHLGT